MKLFIFLYAFVIIIETMNSLNICGMIVIVYGIRDGSMIEDNVVLIGNKPVMNYVLAVITQFNNGSKEVTIKARGRAISRAVDVAEVTKNRFLTEAVIKEIRIATEKMPSDRGESNISTMEIVMVK
jgi:DNA-binding protein